MTDDTIALAVTTLLAAIVNGTFAYLFLAAVGALDAWLLYRFFRR
jgi:hypothetical protein